MRNSCLLLASVIFTTPVLASSYGDSLNALLYQAARTNATLFVGQQATANTNNIAGTILQSSLDANFDGQATISNALTRILGLDKSAAAKTQATATSATSATTSSSSTATSGGSPQYRSNRHHGYRPQSNRRPSNGYYPR